MILIFISFDNPKLLLTHLSGVSLQLELFTITKPNSSFSNDGNDQSIFSGGMAALQLIQSPFFHFCGPALIWNEFIQMLKIYGNGIVNIR